MIEIALYQPDMAPNAGTILRMAACFGLKVRIIEPAGFPWSHYAFRRAGLDYLKHVDVVRYATWGMFAEQTDGQRKILMTTKSSHSYLDFAFYPDDILVMGRETAGVPQHVHRDANARLLIPMRSGMRSLNVAVACALVTGEALRQTKAFGPCIASQ